MRRRLHLVNSLALLVILRVVPAQILDVSAGASTAYNSSGANLRWRGHGVDATLGVGTIGGHFAMGGAMVRSTKDGSVTVGEQEIATDLPTDIFESRHSLVGTGIGLRRNGANGSFVGFSGFTSRGSGSPLFHTASLEQITHFAQWTIRLTPACKQTLTSAAGHAALGIASFECKQNRSHYSMSVGGAYGGAYTAASYAYDGRKLSLKAAYMLAGTHFHRNFSAVQPVPEPLRENIAVVYKPTGHWSFQGSHGHYITQAIEDASAPQGGGNPYRSSLDGLGVQYEQHNLMASVTLLRSSYKTVSSGGTQVAAMDGNTEAASSAVRYRIGPVALSEMLMTSQGSAGAHTAIAVTSAEVTVDSHLRLSEAMNLTKDGMSFSHGGSLLTRYSTFEVGYQFFFVANQPSHPFQQALLFRADVQLPGVDVQASSSVSPTGQPLYTFQVGRSFSHASSTEPKRVTIGRHMVRGRVEDMSGSGIARACLLIDKDRVYTDADGYFFYREGKKHTHYLEVLTTEFVSADTYDVHEAPLKVTSSTSASQLVRVVVQKRKQIA